MKRANLEIVKRHEERFWTKHKKVGLCWEWKGALNRDGHGEYVIWDFGVNFKLAAHRAAYMLGHGEIPEGMVVRHKCHNACCVNPDHLCIGTAAENRMNCVNAGRHAKGRGNGRAKLVEEQVREIRKYYKEGVSVVALAQRYRVDPKAIRSIIQRKTWRDVSDDTEAPVAVVELWKKLDEAGK